MRIMRGSKKDRDAKKKLKKKTPRFLFKKKKCRFCTDKALEISYVNHLFLRKFTTERGKMVPSRVSGNCAKHQRRMAKEIKRARQMALIPYVYVGT